jgi:hypothetical protein
LSVPRDLKVSEAAAVTSAFGSAGFLLRLKLPGQCTSNLNGVGALL